MTKKIKVLLMICMLSLSIGLSVFGGVFALSNIGMNVNGGISFGRDRYPLTLQENGGVYINGYTEPTTYTYSGTTATNLPTDANMYKRGYTLSGWSKNSDLSGSTFTSVAAKSRGPKTFYAKYSENSYTITFAVNGGSWKSGYTAPSSLKVTSSQITLPTSSNISRTGFAFNGWTEKYTFTASDWNAGFINSSTGAFEYNSSYSTAYFTDALLLTKGVTYTLSGGLNDARFRSFTTSGTYLGTASGLTFTPTEDCLTHILYYQSSTEAQRTSTVLTTSGTVASIPTSSIGNRTYTANWSASALTFNDQTLANGAYGSAYNQSFTGASGGTGNYSYTITSVKVGGSASSVSATGLAISGTAITSTSLKLAGAIAVTVQAKDNTSGATASAVMTFTVTTSAPASLAWSTSTQGTATWGAVSGATGYSITLYNGSTAVKTVTATTTSYAFLSDLNGLASAGALTFRVKATAGGYTSSETNSTSNTTHGTLYQIKYIRNHTTSDTTVHARQYFTAGQNTSQYSTNPTKTGYDFAGWYTEAACTNLFSFGSKLTASKVLYANWTGTEYTVVLKPNGGSGADIEKSVNYYKTVTNTSVHSYTGYVLNGYYTNSTGGTKIFNADGSVVASVEGYTNSSKQWIRLGGVTLYAQWSAGTVNYKVEHYKENLDGTYTLGETENKTGTTGNTATASYKTYTGFNSYADHASTVASGTIKADGSLVLKLYYNRIQYRIEAVAGTGISAVSLKVNSGNVTQCADAGYFVRHGASVTIGATVSSGYTWSTWTATGTAPSAFAPKTQTQTFTVDAGDSVLTASAEGNSYTITMNNNGGSGGAVSPATYTISTSSQTVTLTKPTLTGYTLSSWSVTGATGGTPTASGTTLTIPANTYGNLTVKANWTAASYTISYTLNGGSVSTANPTSYTIETETFTLNNPTKPGYSFAGWTGTGLSSETKTVSIAKGSTGNRSYTANWDIVTYTITYNLAGGSVATANPTSYTVETATFTLNNPTRSGYTFAGWTGTGLSSATKTVSIAKGSTGNRSYTATWTQNSKVYLNRNWQSQTSQLLANTSVKTIEFVNTTPSTSGLVSVSGVSNPIWVGADSATDTSNVFAETVKAYVYTNGTIKFYASSVIRAPQDSHHLFSCEDTSQRFTAVTSISFTNFIADEITNINHIFNGLQALSSIDLSTFDTTNVTNVEAMFVDCAKITSVDLSSLSLSKVTSLFGLFNSCISLQSVNISSINFSKVTNMSYMFAWCGKLTSITWPTTINTSSVTGTAASTGFHRMFYSASSIETLDLSKFTINSGVNVTQMLNGMSKLKTFIAPNTLGVALTLPSANFANESLARRLRTLTDTVANTEDGKTFKYAYTITANANGGTLSADSENYWVIASGSQTATQIVCFDETIDTFPVATKTNSVLSSWNTKSDGTGTEYTVDTTPTSAAIIYAIWISAEAKIGTTYYATLEDAFSAVPTDEDATITIITSQIVLEASIIPNSSTNIVLTSDCATTIKRNSATGTFALFEMKNAGKLSIQGGSETNTITIDGQATSSTTKNTSSLLLISSEGGDNFCRLDVEDNTIIQNSAGYGIHAVASDNLIRILGATIQNNKNYGVNSGCVFQMKSGTITGNGTYQVYVSYSHPYHMFDNGTINGDVYFNANGSHIGIQRRLGESTTINGTLFVPYNFTLFIDLTETSYLRFNKIHVYGEYASSTQPFIRVSGLCEIANNCTLTFDNVPREGDVIVSFSTEALYNSFKDSYKALCPLSGQYGLVEDPDNLALVWGTAAVAVNTNTNTYYLTLKEAIEDVTSGSAGIDLLVEDIPVSETITVASGVSIMIDVADGSMTPNVYKTVQCKMFVVNGSLDVQAGITFDGKKLTAGTDTPLFEVSGTLSTYDVDFVNNNSNTAAIVLKDGATLSLEGGLVYYNQSTTNASAIYASGGAFEITLTGVNISENTYTNATGGALGGAIYVGFTTESTVTISDCQFSNNKASAKNDAKGGAIHFGYTTGTNSINGCDFSANQVVSTEGKGYGGAISLHCADVEISDSFFDSNISNGTNDGVGYGGAISAVSATLSMSANEFSYNEAGHNTGYGGALYVNSSTVTDSSTYHPGTNNECGNMATYGSVLSIEGTSTYQGVNNTNRPTLNGETTQTYADYCYGVVHVSGANTVNIKYTNIISAYNGSGYGGGIYKTGTGELKLIGVNVSIQSGAVVEYGGGIYQDGGSITASSFVVKNGNARLSDAVYISKGTFTLGSGSTIAGDGQSGGAVYISNSTDAKFVLNGGTISSGQVYIAGAHEKAFTYKSGTLTSGSVSIYQAWTNTDLTYGSVYVEGTISTSIKVEAYGTLYTGYIFAEFASATVMKNNSSKVTNSIYSISTREVKVGYNTTKYFASMFSTTSTGYISDNMSSFTNIADTTLDSFSYCGIPYKLPTFEQLGLTPKYGYKPVSYNTKADGSGSTLNPGSNFTVGGQINTAYVIWQKEADYEARIGDTYYATLQAAINDASNGDTINIWKDINLTSSLSIQLPLTIESEASSESNPVYIYRASASNSDLIEIETRTNDPVIFTGYITFDVLQDVELSTFLVDRSFFYIISSNVTFDEGITIQNGCTEKGGAIWNDNNSVLTFNGTIQNCSASRGGAIYNSESTVVLNGTISGCSQLVEGSERHGGAIANIDGDLTINGTIINCHADNNGGAIGMYGGTLNITADGIITECTALSGGGVYVDSCDEFILAGEISACTASVDGGGIFSYGNVQITETGSIEYCKAGSAGGGGIYICDAQLLVDGIICGCGYNDGDGFGGGIYAEHSDVWVSGSIEECSSEAGGGVYMCYDSSITVTGAIYGCISGDYGGGAIYSDLSCTIEINGANMTGNASGEVGGLIYFDGSKATRITKTNLIVSGSMESVAGEVYYDLPSSAFVDDGIDTTLMEVKASTTFNAEFYLSFFWADVIQWQQGIFAPVKFESKAIAEATYANLEGNKILGSWETTYILKYNYGVDGFYAMLLDYANEATFYSSSGVITRIGNFAPSTTANGVIAIHAKRIYATATYRLGVGQTIFSNCPQGTTIYKLHVGALFNIAIAGSINSLKFGTSGSTITIGSTSYNSYSLTMDGYPVYGSTVPSSSTATSNSSLITVNGSSTASVYLYGQVCLRYGYAANGGALNVANASATVYVQCDIKYCNAYYGGAIYNNGGTVNFGPSSRKEIYSNKAFNGAGIYNNAGALQMGSSYAYIIGNTATSSGGSSSAYGGAIYFKAGTFAFSAGYIGASGSANTANYGGGIFQAGGTITMSTTTPRIRYNTVTYYGGGVYISYGAFYYNGGYIEYNKTTSTSTSSSGGGGIYNSNGTLSFNATTPKYVRYNETAGRGGGIHNYNNAGSYSYPFKNIYIIFNKAYDGGGIYQRFSTMYLNESTYIEHNEASHYGGGIYNSKNLYMNNASVYIRYNDSGGAYFGSEIYNASDGVINCSAAVSIQGDSLGATVVNYGSLTMSAGKVDSIDCSAIVYNAGTLTKTGGSITNEGSQGNGYGLYNVRGTATLNCGISCGVGIPIYVEGGTVNLTGGSYGYNGLGYEYTVYVEDGAVLGLSGSISMNSGIGHNGRTAHIFVQGYDMSTQETTYNTAVRLIGNLSPSCELGIAYGGVETYYDSMLALRGNYTINTNVAIILPDCGDGYWVTTNGSSAGNADWLAKVSTTTTSQAYQGYYFPCFTVDTEITVWDDKKKRLRKKKAKDIKYSDKLLVWNFDKGCFDFAKPLYIQKEQTIDKYTEVGLSDGSVFKVVKEHSVYSVDKKGFRPILSNNPNWGMPIGSRVFKEDGTIATIVYKKEIKKTVEYTNIITNYHMNVFTSGMLTSTPLNNCYFIDDNMKFIKEDTRCNNMSLLEGVSEEWIKGLRLDEKPDYALLKILSSCPGAKTMKDWLEINKLSLQKPREE